MRPAVDFIGELRQSGDLAALPVGRRVVVVGGGMTAIDAAVQSKLLGAEEVTILYRRARENMGASGYEQELAATRGVRIVTNAVPIRVEGDGSVARVVVAHTARGRRPRRDRRGVRAAADEVLVAIGQRLAGVPVGLDARRAARSPSPMPAAPAARASGPAATARAAATT